MNFFVVVAVRLIAGRTMIVEALYQRFVETEEVSVLHLKSLGTWLTEEVPCPATRAVHSTNKNCLVVKPGTCL